ncbi:MAG TPA: serine hydrolase domain-containing protein [Stackebrandtia sp.]|jgi:CubicO group peptidase (beta-lactamase class C family)|uniref:serine hydrolase domain-containing protein n=1 Tax=Stackebrandtia sp. TaxID=2023065 RepID=UPI002D729BAE|nr:serine hydrolase domain-containing protein [Stackebrandtia sp.]HZE40543.1 serine hydrolase domain-containing protein [Stackebrandtia sp.]
MKRRDILGGIVIAGSAPILGGMIAPAAAAAEEGKAGPPTVTPDDLRFHRRRLRPGSPREAGLLKPHVDKIVGDTAAFMKPGEGRPRPSHPGFVVLAARRGVIVTHESGGYALRYASYDSDTDTAVDLPEDQKIAMRTDTRFDLASMSKLFTSMVATQLHEDGDIDLDAPVADYLPDFAASDPAKAPITLKFLLRHVSGLKSWLPLYTEPDNAARMRAIYTSELHHAPGTTYEYSDLNLITMGVLIEKVTGSTLDAEVKRRITDPLGLRDTGYNPPKSQLDRIAATEYQLELRGGVVHGEVHDENAWSFGGVAGHAGIFSTAADVAVFAQTILNGGTYGGERLLRQDTVRALLTNYNADLPPEAGRGLGWQLDQRFYMDALSTPVSAGHTGFTGTCVVVDPSDETLYVLLTNRVHPTRNWGTDSAYRRAGAHDLARAVAVDAHTPSAWYTGAPDATVATLSLPLETPPKDGRLSFLLWYDTEDTDVGELLAGGADGTFSRVPLQLRSGAYEWNTDGSFHGFSARRWIRANADLPADTATLRWQYTTDPQQRGRGVYVDRVVVRDGHRVVFDGERGADAKRFEADGWQPSRD